GKGEETKREKNIKVIFHFFIIDIDIIGYGLLEFPPTYNRYIFKCTNNYIFCFITNIHSYSHYNYGFNINFI
ncbi:hypothetical protein DEJ66_15675, partial [Bacilli bacterium]